MIAPPEPLPPAPRLLDRVRWHLRVKRYSIRTEQAYVDWIRRYVLFQKKRHPAEMGENEIAQFQSHLAVDQRVAASTQNQAFSALLFLYQQVLEKKLDFVTGVERVRRPPKLPVVFTRAEARAVLARLTGDYRLMAHLLYGSGLRLLECLRLRVKDIDFGYRQITVREGKGLRQRVTILPDQLICPLQSHLDRVKQRHQQDLARGGGTVIFGQCLTPKISEGGA
jgi:integrase